MRTDATRSPWARVFDRLRARGEPTRRWLANRRTIVRWGLGTGGLAILIVSGYLLSSTTEAIDSAWLFDDRKISREDANKIVAALAAAEIPATVNAQGQVAVARDRKVAALAVVDKQKLSPPRLRDLRGDASASIWETSDQREERQAHRSEQKLEVLIEELDGIASADVLINRTKARGRTPASVKALVRLRGNDGRPIPSQTIQTIRAILSNEPDLPADAVTILDVKGQPYVMAGNPEVVARSEARAREEELREAIHGQLNWIEGLRVFVNLELEPVTHPVAVVTTAAAPTIAVNQPLGDAPQEKPSTAVASTTKATWRALVLVQVPISHYVRKVQSQGKHRDPSPDDLKPYVEKTEDSIRTTVATVVPAAEFGSLKISRYDDPIPLAPPPASSAVAARSLRNWWLPVAAGAGLAALGLLAIAGRWLAGRRPEPVAQRFTPRAERFDAGHVSGPSERVRELVRRDPVIAAGVLQRWIGQGGPSS